MLNFFLKYPKRYRYYYFAGILALTASNYIGTLIPRKIEEAIDVFRFFDSSSSQGSSQSNTSLSAPSLDLSISSLSSDSAESLKYICITMAVLSLSLLVVRTFSRILFFFPGRFVEFDLRNDLFTHLLKLSDSFYLKNEIGDLMSRLINDIQHLRLLVGFALLNIVNTLILFPFAIWQMAQINKSLTFYSLLPVPIILVLVIKIAKHFHKSIQASQKLLGQVTSKSVESFSRIATIKTFTAEKAFKKTFDETNVEYKDAMIDVAFYRSIMFPLLAIIGSIGNFVLFFFGGPMILANKLTVGEFVAFSSYIAILSWPTASLAYIISVYQRGKVAADRIDEIFSEEASIVDSGKTNFALKIDDPPSIKLKDFSYSYPGDEAKVLNNISFQLGGGESLGIFGSTGSGKSTLAEILARNLEIDEDSGLIISGEDLTSWSVDEYRKALSYVPQNSFLFSNTIAENIAYFEKSEKPLMEKVKLCAKKASLESDIETFPKGYETYVGEKGVVLSGGQKNRLALARAFYKPHKLLILDDVLSSVDSETEKNMIDALSSVDASKAKVKADKITSVIISHRISVLTKCDIIIVLDKGNILASGSHQELINLPGIYKDTWEYQQMVDS